MQVLIDRDKLLATLTKCRLVSDKKPTQPIASCVLIQASGHAVTITATNFYAAIQEEIFAEIREEGSTVVNTDELYLRVKMLSFGTLELVLSKNDLEIRDCVKHLMYKLPHLNADDYPVIQEPDERDTKIEFDATQLLQMLDQTKHAMSMDTSRPKLHSTLFEIGKKKSPVKGKSVARMVATDGHRMAFSDVLIPQVSFEKSLLIPYKSCIALSKFLKGNQSTVTLVDSTQGFFVNIDDLRFSTCLVNEAPVPVDSVMTLSSTKKCSCILERLRLLAAIKATALSANEYTGGITLTLDTNILTVQGDDPEKGKASDAMSVDYDGKDFVAGYNARYLVDVLEACPGDTVTLQVSEALDPLIIKPETEEEDSSFLGIVMPVRL